ncbi:MAG: hypothetical protein M3352_11460 [Bacteroidota bacterium]|nr:hypothetical protein [Bacteroidota bacterium]
MILRIELPEKFVCQLVNLPESGMGYQMVKVFLKDGKVLKKHKVFNASVLELLPNEKFSHSDIVKIELDK